MRRRSEQPAKGQLVTFLGSVDNHDTACTEFEMQKDLIMDKQLQTLQCNLEAGVQRYDG